MAAGCAFLGIVLFHLFLLCSPKFTTSPAQRCFCRAIFALIVPSVMILQALSVCSDHGFVRRQGISRVFKRFCIKNSGIHFILSFLSVIKWRSLVTTLANDAPHPVVFSLQKNQFFPKFPMALPTFHPRLCPQVREVTRNGANAAENFVRVFAIGGVGGSVVLHGISTLTHSRPKSSNFFYFFSSPLWGLRGFNP